MGWDEKRENFQAVGDNCFNYGFGVNQRDFGRKTIRFFNKVSEFWQ